jgi:hypothetical protein
MKDAFSGIIGETGVAEIRSSGKDPITYARRPFEDTIGGVCSTCNNGWMSLLETDVQPSLTPMMTTGVSASLTPEMRLKLATWAVKTTLVLDQLTPAKRAVPDSEYLFFYQRQAPLPYHEVLIGRIDPSVNNLVVSTIQSKIQMLDDITDTPTVRYLRRGAELGQWLYVFTFSIGFVVFQVLGHNFPRAIHVRRPELFNQTMETLWPGLLTITWPPGLTIDRIGRLAALHEAYTLTPAP